MTSYKELGLVNTVDLFKKAVAGGYANFGDILNDREDSVWAVQVKYEF